jgi:hypothetical protein
VQRGIVVFRDDDYLTATFSLAQASVLGDRLIAALDRLARADRTAY